MYGIASAAPAEDASWNATAFTVGEGSSSASSINDQLRRQAFTFADLEVVRTTFDGLTVSVVSPRTLYLMKRDTVRLKDKAYAALLRERFHLEDP